MATLKKHIQISVLATLLSEIHATIYIHIIHNYLGGQTLSPKKEHRGLLKSWPIARGDKIEAK